MDRVDAYEVAAGAEGPDACYAQLGPVAVKDDRVCKSQRFKAKVDKEV